MFSQEDKELLKTNMSEARLGMALEKFYYPSYYKHNNVTQIKNQPKLNTSVTTAYPFSNERVGVMFKSISTGCDSALIMGSSFDQVLNALYNGVTSVTSIDANLFTKYYSDYKIAAIKNLEYNEFKDAFINSYTLYSPEIYHKIFKDLDAESQAFWGEVFLNQEHHFGTYSATIFRTDVKKQDIKSEFYLNPLAYLKMQQILKNGDYKINYITAEFSDFPEMLQDKSFELITLSNVYQYLPKETFKTVVDSLYKNNLSEGGKLQIAYFYQSPGIKNYFTFKKLFKHLKYLKLALPDPEADNHYAYVAVKPEEDIKPAHYTEKTK